MKDCLQRCGQGSGKAMQCPGLVAERTTPRERGERAGVRPQEKAVWRAPPIPQPRAVVFHGDVLLTCHDPAKVEKTGYPSLTLLCPLVSYLGHHWPNPTRSREQGSPSAQSLQGQLPGREPSGEDWPGDGQTEASLR